MSSSFFYRCSPYFLSRFPLGFFFLFLFLIGFVPLHFFLTFLVRLPAATVVLICILICPIIVLVHLPAVTVVLIFILICTIIVLVISFILLRCSDTALFLNPDCQSRNNPWELMLSQTAVPAIPQKNHLRPPDAGFDGIGPPECANGFPTFSLKINQLERQPKLMLQLEAVPIKLSASVALLITASNFCLYRQQELMLQF